MSRKDVEARHAHWAAMIQEADTSGMTYSAWCKEHAVNLNQFYRWRRKLRESNAEKESGSANGTDTIREIPSRTVFCEIPAPAAGVRPLQNGIADDTAGFLPEAMLLLGQSRLLIGSGVSEETLKTILAVLSHV